MADIDIQRKTTPVWPWILGIIIVVAIILFLVAGRDRDQLQNIGGGPNEPDRPIPGQEVPGQTINPPSPANPDAPNRSDGRNPQVPPATPDRPPAPPAPSESTIDKAPQPSETNQPSDTTKPNDGASLELEPYEQVYTDQNPELALENTDADDQNTDADDQNAENSVIIFEDDEFIDETSDNPQFAEFPPEVAAFSQFLIQNSDTQGEFTTIFTADGIRNLNDAIYVLAAQDDDVLNEQRDGNRAQLDELADQIDNSSSQSEQARHAADAFSLAADWIEEVSEVLYPTTEPQAQAVLQAADEFDPEQSLNDQLPAVRAFFDRANSALQEMANA